MGFSPAAVRSGAHQSSLSVVCRFIAVALFVVTGSRAHGLVVAVRGGSVVMALKLWEHGLNKVVAQSLVAPQHGSSPHQGSNLCLLHW